MKGKLIKIISATGLAMIMGVGVLCGVLIAPAGATSASNGGNLASAAQSADGAPKVVENPDGTIQIGMSQEETASALMNGTWECSPETDPIVYTTDYGLDVKMHLTGYLADPSTVGKLESGKFSGYAYIEAAGVKWAIIGRSSTITNKALTGHFNIASILSTYSSFSGYSTDSLWQMLVSPDTTLAGPIIYNEISEDYVYCVSGATAIYSNPSTIFPNAIVITNTNILAQDEVLCFAQAIVQSSVTFNSSTSQKNNYSGSNLQTVVNNWYANNLKSSWDSYIVSKTLTTLYYNSVTSSVSAKLFPLAGVNSSESFYYGTYISSGNANMDVDANWWLRSGNAKTNDRAYSVNPYGQVLSSEYVNASYGVRPAFVLKI